MNTPTQILSVFRKTLGLLLSVTLISSFFAPTDTENSPILVSSSVSLAGVMEGVNINSLFQTPVKTIQITIVPSVYQPPAPKPQLVAPKTQSLVYTPKQVSVPILTVNINLQTQAQQILASRGLSSQWPEFNYIITHESGWNLYARNASGACGLPQALPCSKIVWGDSNAQINWAITYMMDRYGSIPGAYRYWLTHHNY